MIGGTKNVNDIKILFIIKIQWVLSLWKIYVVGVVTKLLKEAIINLSLVTVISIFVQSAVSK